MNNTKWLNETNLNEVNLVGGKNASLGSMIQNLQSLNIKVPNGFVITTDCYDYFLKYNHINVAEYDNSKEIRSLIQNSDFPLEIMNEISQKYTELSNQYNCDEVDVAVRSSSNAEDCPDASFAGQQDTYLNIKGIHNVLKYIKYCFASLFNDRAISYRKSMNYENFDSKLSVTIQKMVNCDQGSAGVAFSIDVNSGFKDSIIINSAFGLGELVVSGNVKPDEFVISKKCLFNGNKCIIQKNLGHKNEKIVFDLENGGTKFETLSQKQYQQFSLSDNIIHQLSNWVIQLEKFYSQLYNKYCPVDVEWGYDGNDLYILQCRPETVNSNKNSNIFTQYKTINLNQNKLICNGIAIGDGIQSGIVKKFNSIEEITNDNFHKGDILVTTITDPDWEPIMKKAGAIITNKGGRTCHAAIVARELGVVTIVGTVNATELLHQNQSVSVVCCNGEIGSVYQDKVEFEKEVIDLNDLPTINTKLMMNLASPEIASKVCNLPSHGVGLLREEFIINNYIKIHPLALIHYHTLTDTDLIQKIEQITIGYNDKKQYFIDKLVYGLSTIASAFWGKDVIVRFSDFKSNEYYNLLGGKYFEPHEENPMIGWRGASRYYSKSFKEAFGLECLAIKKVREEYGLKNIIVMLPFVRTVEECKLVLNTMEEFGLKRHKNNLKVYIMCEIPSNVICANEFCDLVDGFSIGSNDLTQLTLGLDRDSELISNLYNENNIAVKRLISNVIKICKQKNVKVGICGQGPSDSLEFAKFLIEENIDTISLTPDSIVKTIINLSKIN